MAALITTHDIQAASVLERVRSIIDGSFRCENLGTDIISSDASAENGTIEAKPYEQIETETFDDFTITKLIITSEINEVNKKKFLVYLSAFEDLQELILQNCEDLESIFVDELNALQKLRHLELHNFYMSSRCAGGYGYRGVAIENLLAVLNIQSLESLTLTGHDLTEKDREALRHNAKKKGVTIILKGWWPFR
jgi:hypothetical protein